MAVQQSKLEEIRYLRRQNLEEEAKIIGNYYRDIIRQYGVDCKYYKIKIPYMEVFRKILDDNNMILHAYGEDVNPDYSISSEMITFMEVENDVFQLNKYGVTPNADVNLYFNTVDFACSLASKLGQLKEYPIKEKDFIIEVPYMLTDEIEYFSDDEDPDNDLEEPLIENEYSFPYYVGRKVPEYYESEILSGRFSVKIGPYTLSTDSLSNRVSPEYTVMCHPYEHGDVDKSFPVNDTIFKSFNHTIGTTEFIDQMLFLTYRIHEIKTSKGSRCILKGKLHGSVLFHDISKVGKYIEMIHPDVGDIITIGFPDENNRQQYEITECYDKNMTNDGINPLLHTYVWKCKARRYVNSGEDFPEKNEENEKWAEKIDLLDNSTEDVVNKIAEYDEDANDASYGGYERIKNVHDKNKVDKEDYSRMQFIDDGTYITIFTFQDQSMLITNGYELFFVDTKKYCYQITTTEEYESKDYNLVPSDLQYLKATEDALFFVNFEGKAQMLCEDEDITQGEIQNCLNSLIDATYDVGNPNKDGDHYYKFRESNTVLMSLHDKLYCRFGNKNHKIIRLNTTYPEVTQS